MNEEAIEQAMSKMEPVQLDALQEICNIGMGHAATALSQMIGRTVNLSIPRVTLAPIADVPDILGGPEKIVAGIYMKIFGDIRGNMLLVFPKASAQGLITMLTGEKFESETLILNDMNASALKEVGNILAGAYLGALESVLNMSLLVSVPSLGFDMAGAVIDYILIQLGQEVDVTLVVETEFFGCEETALQGHFFLLPDPRSLDLILKACRVKSLLD